LGFVTASAARVRSPGAQSGSEPPSAVAGRRPLILIGTLAAAAVTASGLAVVTVLVVAGWMAAPHSGLGLRAVLRTAAVLWLVGQHVGFTLHGVGRIGFLPLGLVVLPGALLWRAGRWVSRVAAIGRLRHVGYAALALAGPYAVFTAALAQVSRSSEISASVPQAALCGLLLGLAAGGLGAARALAPWRQLLQLLPPRSRSLVLAVAATVAVLAATGALLAAAALAVHLPEAFRLQRSLGAGLVGTVLLLLLQIGYVPNAIVWAIAFSLGPGFAFGSGTIVAATGSALGELPAFPLLAALPPGVHDSVPVWLTPVVLALPYLAGGIGGWLLVRTAPTMSLEGAPLWGMATGALAGCLLGLLAAFAGGPLGDGRLAAVGPSPWQVAAIGGLELGIGAAVTAGVVNFVILRSAGAPSVTVPAQPATGMTPPAEHVIYVDPWGGDRTAGQPPAPAGPSALP
jgi:Family of unknown function (DUF6350)